MKPLEFVEALREARASAILRTPHAGAVRPAMEAAVRAGFRVVEFTLTTPGALEHIRDFSSIPGLLVGAGTVLSAAEARSAVAAGARFLVSPVVDADVIRAAKELDVAVMPGCATPTEMLAAFRHGAPLQKLFPSPADGPGWVRSCLGPLPFLRIVPTNGVDAANVAAYFEAGAFAVGYVASLFNPADLEAGRFERVEERARALLKAAQPRAALRA